MFLTGSLVFIGGNIAFCLLQQESYMYITIGFIIGGLLGILMAKSLKRETKHLFKPVFNIYK